MTHILVTPRSLSSDPTRSLGRLEDLGYTLVCPSPGQTPTESQLLEAISDCVGWIAGVEPVSDKVIQAANRLKVISRNGSGVDNLPLERLKSRRISVKRAVGANADGVAELAVALMMAGFRQIPLCDRGIRTGQWPRPMGKNINGARIGIVGLGAIGTLVSQKFIALGAHVIGHDPFHDSAKYEGRSGFSFAENIADLVENADGVSLHAPSSADEAPIFGRNTLDKAKPGLVIVNTARALLVDTEALTDALDTGIVSAFATDVFEKEPPLLTPLLSHERTILTSHIGGLTSSTVKKVVEDTIDNLLSGLAEVPDEVC